MPWNWRIQQVDKCLRRHGKSLDSGESGNIYPKATTNRAILASDRFIEDGSYLKLKTLSLSYSFLR